MKWQTRHVYCDFYKNNNFGENLARGNGWLAKNSNEMAKNGLLVIRDFCKDSKSWRKCLIWAEYMKSLNNIQMRGQWKLPWKLLIFRKKQIFAKNGEFNKSSSNVWQEFINELTKRKHVKIWVPFEIEPRVVPDLMVLKWQRNIWHSTWHWYQEKTKHFYCRWRRYILWLKYFYQCIEMELTNKGHPTKNKLEKMWPWKRK